MTPASLRKVCVENDGYAHAPELNDVCICTAASPRSKIRTVRRPEDHLPREQLRGHARGPAAPIAAPCLYMAKNALMDVEGAVQLKALVTLDISENPRIRWRACAGTELATLCRREPFGRRRRGRAARVPRLTSLA